MEKIVVDIIGDVFKMLLRYWTGGNADNFNDIKEFAKKRGLTYLESKKLDRTIEDFIDTVAKDFIEEFGTQINDEERKEAILFQIKKDIQKINISENRLISEIHNSVDLQIEIMSQSEQERKLWSESELGVYTNCIKYISKMVMNFVSKLPSFSANALKIVIQRQNEYYNELREILTDIHSMANLIKSAEVKYREYESIYREKIIEKYGKIELIGSKLQDRHLRRYDITSAYVELNCIGEKSMEEVGLDRVFETSNVVWIKGEAGAGKTTFLQWVAICAAKGDYSQINNIENAIPIVIGLRSIEWPFNLHNVVDKITAAEGINCPEGWIHELLKKQEIILLFDGLDEISKVNREQIYTYIENTIKKYPNIRILLTARNSVRDNIDCEKSCYEIAPMKMDRIREFISYWHDSVLRHDAIIEDAEIEKLQYNLKKRIIESQSLSDIARNPLLCAMLCALNYVNNEQIPEDKMQLYEQCCEMLMDARDSQRNIDVSIYENIPPLDYNMKKRILEELAFRMINNGVSSENRRNISSFMAQLLKDTNIILDAKNKYSADNILDFLIERSGIIREPEEGVIDFIHKTFMEFLAVKTICRNCDWDILIKEACNVNWRETIVMCFREMGNSNVDYVLNKMVEKGKNEHDDRYFLMASLCASNAKFFHASIKDIINEKIKEMIPPSDEKIEEMAELGLYILSFLKDSKEYSYEEKSNCLKLLAINKFKEAIPVILTYITHNTYIEIYQLAVNILWQQYTELELDEYNVKEHLINVMLKSIYEDKIFTCDTMLYILKDYQLTIHEKEILNPIKKVIIFCQNSKISKHAQTDFPKYFKECDTVNLIGELRNLSFLKPFRHIKNLELESEVNLPILTYELKELKNLISVTSLYIDSNQAEVYLISRIKENMKNIEIIEFKIRNPNLALYSNTFDGFVKLKTVIFNVNRSLALDIERSKNKLKGENSALEIIANPIDDSL